MQDVTDERRPARVHLAPGLRATLERWSLDAYPAEACGVLLGRRVGAELAIADVTLARNLLAESAPSAATRAFDLHPADLVLAEDRAHSRGVEIVGIWHSHPDAPAAPSEEDRLPSNTWCHVLVAVERGSIWATRAFDAGLAELSFVPSEVPTTV